MGLGPDDSKTWIETLNYDKNLLGNLLEKSPKNHIAITYFNKLETLEPEQYKQMAEE